jgi:hypothetical protein
MTGKSEGVKGFSGCSYGGRMLLEEVWVALLRNRTLSELIRFFELPGQ